MKKNIVGSILMAVLVFALFMVAVPTLPLLFGIWGIIATVGLGIVVLWSMGVVLSKCTTNTKTVTTIKKISNSLVLFGLIIVLLSMATFGCITFSKYVIASTQDPINVEIPETTTPPVESQPETIVVKPSKQPSEEVKLLQIKIGLTGSDIDGLWGPKSEAALKKYNEAQDAAIKLAEAQAKADAEAKARLEAQAKADKAAADKLVAETEAKRLAEEKAKADAIKALANITQPTWYDDTSRHSVSTYTWTLTVKPEDYGMIGGVFVKITNSSGKVLVDNTSSQQGVYVKKLYPGTYTVTITDGFALTINKANVNAEWDARIKQAEVNGWAKNFQYTGLLY